MITFILTLLLLGALAFLSLVRALPVSLDHPVSVGVRTLMRKTRRGWSSFQVMFGLNRTITLVNTAPTVTLTPFDPNADVHSESRLSFLADAAITVRWSLVTIGATAGKTVKANTASSTPLGVIDDTTDTVNSDLTIPVHVRLFEGTGATLKVAVNSTVNVGDYLIPDTSNPIYGMTDPGINLNRFGRALTAGVAGGVVEFSAFQPTRIASGSFTSAGSVTTDAITIAGLLATDFVVVTLAVQAGTETIKTATAAAGQINLVYSSNSGATTKVNYAVFRA